VGRLLKVERDASYWHLLPEHFLELLKEGLTAPARTVYTWRSRPRRSASGTVLRRPAPATRRFRAPSITPIAARVAGDRAAAFAVVASIPLGDVLSGRGRCGNATFTEFYDALDCLTHLFFVCSSKSPHSPLT
jgi:hypothetical protein